jgi:L-aminopeptidase/D-esterase-like protein
MAQRISLTSLDGVRVGHERREDRPTGCTVVLTPGGAVAGVDVRGAAPGTRETDLLRPEKTVDVVHAVLLAGGSAFGLAAADGVMRFLREREIGYPTGSGPVPIVPAAILYDLGIGESGSYPDAENGFAACAAATAAPVLEGSVGAGSGATVGKMFGGRFAMKGGIGSAGLSFDDGTIVAALMAVNCRGDVRDPATGRIVAGARSADGSGLRDAAAEILAGAQTESTGAHNTTIGIVATDRKLTKSECTHLAAVAHDGLARAITPAHTRFDGDTVFFLSTGSGDPPENGAAFDRLEIATAAAAAEAVFRACTEATGLPGYPSARELGTV